jgi:glycosyltransferase involved in cell wall biosynthesis
MRVLVIHDRWFGGDSGGESNVVERERNLLSARGVEIRMLEWRKAPAGTSLAAKAWVLGRGTYSTASRARVTAAVRDFAPDAVHIHNFWPQATAAAHYACRAAGVGVVQTLHNYLILCANGVLLRNQRLCELCVDSRLPWHGLVHRCARGSLSRSAVVAAAFGAHRLADTWNRTVDVFVAPSRSMRDRFVRAGIDPRRIVIKPQSAPDHGAGTAERSYFLYAGRLSPEKGIAGLLRAWQGCDHLELHLAGTGALAEQVRAAAVRQPNIRYLGALPAAAVAAAMRGAVATVVPSLWEEPFPLVIAESYAAGTPVIAADVGSRGETVADRETGIVFPAGDAEALRRAVCWAAAHPEELRQMGRAARRRYETHYSEEAAWTQLSAIYEQARRAADERRGLKR